MPRLDARRSRPVGEAHEHCACMRALLKLADNGRFTHQAIGAIEGFHDAHRKNGWTIPNHMKTSLQKRIAGQFKSLVRGIADEPRTRFDPYKQHCRTCSCVNEETTPTVSPRRAGR